ncbi:MAG: HEAT repeat domain-containing protein [Planctomycetota bacterium]
MWNLAPVLLIALTSFGSAHAAAIQDPLKLPPRSPSAQQDPQGSAESFRQAITGLRRRLRLSSVEEQRRIGQIGRSFDNVVNRCFDLLPGLRSDEAYGALKILQRYGGGAESRSQVEQLEFLLVSQRFGKSTSVAVETLAAIAGDDAPDALLRCMTIDRASVRRAALEALRPIVRADQVDRLLDLSESDDEAIQRACFDLLGRLPVDERVNARLLRGLSQAPMTGLAAAEALVSSGPDVVSALQGVVRRPARGRAYGYAAFALARIEFDHPEVEAFTEDMVDVLVREFDTSDKFQRSAIAIALGRLAYESADLAGERYADAQVLESLVDVVSPITFIDHLASLTQLAEARLVQLSGETASLGRAEWRDWWTARAEIEGLCGARRRLPVEDLDPKFLRLHWRGLASDIYVQGPKAFASEDEGAFIYLVDEDRMRELVAKLETLGFMSDDVPTGEVAAERSLSLGFGSTVSRTPRFAEDRTLARFADLVFDVAEQELWQLYRDPIAEPDRAAYWRSETRWRQSHTEEEQDRRLLDRIVSAVVRLEGQQRLVAVGHLTSIEGYESMLTESQGLRLATVATETEVWDDGTIRLAQLALLAPGQGVWQRLVAAAEARDLVAEPGGVAALPRVFSILGIEQVREVVRSGSPKARSTAILELAEAKDLEITDDLLAAVADAEENASIRDAAIYALGELQASSAREPLLAMIADPKAAGLSRNSYRTALRSLGRIGGSGVVDALRDALVRGDESDQIAAVQALGAMRDDFAVRELTRMMVLRGRDTLGQIARDQIRQQGDLRATPALLSYLEHRSPAIVRRVSLLLGEFQEPEAIDRLANLLDDPEESARAARLISGTTGIDLVNARRRFETLLAWRQEHRQNTQGAWLIEALDREGIQHSLNPAALVPGAGAAAVPELARLAEVIESPVILPLLGRVMRRVTDQDFGNIDPFFCSAERRLGILERYRLYHESAQAAASTGR